MVGVQRSLIWEYWKVHCLGLAWKDFKYRMIQWVRYTWSNTYWVSIRIKLNKTKKITKYSQAPTCTSSTQPSLNFRNLVLSPTHVSSMCSVHYKYNSFSMQNNHCTTCQMRTLHCFCFACMEYNAVFNKQV